MHSPTELQKLVGWHAPRSPGELNDDEKRCEKAKTLPFLDEHPFTGNPSCKWDDFRLPLLQRFDLRAKVEWKERLGHGIDGVAWRVHIGCQTFAVKVVSIFVPCQSDS